MRRFFSDPSLLVVLVIAALVWWVSQRDVLREQQAQLVRMQSWHNQYCHRHTCSYDHYFN
jgi:hypothetical protein